MKSKKLWQGFFLLCVCLGTFQAAHAFPRLSLHALGSAASSGFSASSVSSWGQISRPKAVSRLFLASSRGAQTSSPATGSRETLGTSRQALLANTDLLTAGLIVLIPTVAIELTLFIGNLAAFSLNKRLLAWGIQGMGFAVLGGAVTIPWIALGLETGIAVSFIALHVLLLGVSVTNIILGTQGRNTKVAVVPWGGVGQGGSAIGGLAATGKF